MGFGFVWWISYELVSLGQLMFSTVLLHWYLYRDGPTAPKKATGNAGENSWTWKTWPNLNESWSKIRFASYVASYRKQDIKLSIFGGIKEATKNMLLGVILREILRKKNIVPCSVWVDFSYFMRNSPRMAFQLTTVARSSQEMDLSTWQRLNRGIETNGTNVPDHVQQQVYALVNKAAARLVFERKICWEEISGKKRISRSFFWRWVELGIAFEDGLNWELGNVDQDFVCEWNDEGGNESIMHT